MSINLWRPLVDLRVAFQDFDQVFVFNINRRIHHDLFHFLIKLPRPAASYTIGMNDICQLIVVQIPPTLHKLLFKQPPESVLAEIILLQKHCSNDIHQCGGEEIRQPFFQIIDKDLINRLISFEHIFQTFFWHV